MINGKKCAAIILNYNDAERTIAFRNSIIEYDLLDYIFIVDNCSPDNSFEKLTTIIDSKTIVVKTEKNGGYGYGNNYGVNLANDYLCEIAFICNSDITVSEECFQKISKCLLSNEEAVICSAVQINGYTKTPINGLAWRIPTVLDYIRNSLVLLKRLYPAKEYDYEKEQVRVDCVPGAFLGVNIPKFLECGGYDEGIFLFCEESTIAARTKSKGYSTILLTNCEYYHYHSSSIKKSFPQELKTYKMTLNSRRYFLVNYRNVKGLRLLLVDTMFAIGYFEQSILYYIRKKQTNEI